MLFDHVSNGPSPASGGILVVSRRGIESDECVRILNSNAQPDWNRQGSCVQHLLVNGARYRDDVYLAHDIDQFLREFPDIEFEVFLRRPFPISDNVLQRKKLPWSVAYCEDRFPFFEQQLRRALRNFRLDWYSRVCNELCGYLLGGTAEITKKSIEKWLNQFDALGGLKWVGVGLLRSLQFETLRSLTNRVMPIEKELGDFDYICLYTNAGVPKSGDAMRFLIEKQFDTIPTESQPKFCTLREAVNRPDPSRILWVEDGIHTGTEIRNLISALQGRTKPGHAPKVPPIENPEWINNKWIQFRFGTSSNFGLRILNSFLAENDLDKFEVYNTESESFSALTPSGCEAFEDGSLWSDGKRLGELDSRTGPFLANPIVHLNLHAFRDEIIWGSRRREAASLCREIGKQLFRGYLEQQVENRNWTMWDERCIEECGLGMMGLGYALAFQHSVPKCSLPLLWAGGEVELKFQDLKTGHVMWEPLFPGVV